MTDQEPNAYDRLFELASHLREPFMEIAQPEVDAMYKTFGRLKMIYEDKDHPKWEIASNLEHAAGNPIDSAGKYAKIGVYIMFRDVIEEAANLGRVGAWEKQLGDWDQVVGAEYEKPTAIFSRLLSKVEAFIAENEHQVNALQRVLDQIEREQFSQNK